MPILLGIDLIKVAVIAIVSLIAFKATQEIIEESAEGLLEGIEESFKTLCLGVALIASSTSGSKEDINCDIEEMTSAVANSSIGNSASRLCDIINTTQNDIISSAVDKCWAPEVSGPSIEVFPANNDEGIIITDIPVTEVPSITILDTPIIVEQPNNVEVFPEQRVDIPIIIDFPAEKQNEKDNIIFIEGVADPKLFKVSDSALNHSSVGDFTYNPKTGKVSKMKGGGHGQANIDFLDANGLKYEVVDTYPNGVRVGNVADHKVKAKRTGSNQSWFPESWTESDIVNAGEYVGNLKENINAVDGFISYGEVNGVRVGVIRTNGQISTVFSDATMQP